MKKNRGWMGYVVVLSIFMVIAIVLNGSLAAPKPKLTSDELWAKIDAGEVQRVAIRGTNLWGLLKDTKVAEDQFPEGDYDFTATVYSYEEFLAEAIKHEAKQPENADVPVERIGKSDLDFAVDSLPPLTIPPEAEPREGIVRRVSAG